MKEYVKSKKCQNSNMKSVICEKLNYSIGDNEVIHNLTFNLEPGSRCLLVGSNGVGKTTLLKLLGGKNLCQGITILGKHSYHDTSLNFQRVLIDQSWGLRTVAFAGNNIPYVSDIKVESMMKELQKQFKERRNCLIKLLDIDLQWRMHQISSGQRRRVQIFLALLRPVKLILLDEITNVSDIICREKLLDWLKRESIENRVTIVYATHIFDGLENWYTDVLYLKKDQGESLGKFVTHREITIPIYDQIKHWLQTQDASMEKTPKEDKLKKSYNSGGGYAPGRFYNYWG